MVTKQFKPIEVTVKDKDNLSSDTCGVTSMGIDALKQQPNQWAINHIFPLKDQDTMKGSVYICAKFIPEGSKDDGSQPQFLVHK